MFEQCDQPVFEVSHLNQFSLEDTAVHFGFQFIVVAVIILVIVNFLKIEKCFYPRHVQLVLSPKAKRKLTYSKYSDTQTTPVRQNRQN